MTESQFLDGVPEKDGVTFFRGKVVVYYINGKLKSEIFNKKKFINKMLFTVLNWEILTKNLVTFKR